METQHDFIERRRLGHEQAAQEGANCPLIKARFGPHEPVKPIKASMLYSEGFMLKRQAGDPIDAPVSLDHTVIGITDESRGLGESSSNRRRNRRRRFVVRLGYGFARALRWLQQATARLTCPTP